MKIFLLQWSSHITDDFSASHFFSFSLKNLQRREISFRQSLHYIFRDHKNVIRFIEDRTQDARHLFLRSLTIYQLLAQMPLWSVHRFAKLMRGNFGFAVFFQRSKLCGQCKTFSPSDFSVNLNRVNTLDAIYVCENVISMLLETQKIRWIRWLDFVSNLPPPFC